MVFRNTDVPIMQADAMSDYDIIAVDDEKIRKMVGVIQRSITTD